MNVYAQFSNNGDRLNNVHAASLWTDANSGFFQSVGNPFWKPGATQNAFTSDDSWVTVGLNPSGNGRANPDTFADANFLNFDDSQGATEFDELLDQNEGAGWFTTNPAYGYANVVGDTGRVLIAHLVFAGAQESATVFFGGSLSVTYANGESAEVTIPIQTFAIFPAPSGLALLLLGANWRQRGRRR